MSEIEEIKVRVIPNYPDYSISSKGEIFRNSFRNHHTYLPI